MKWGFYDAGKVLLQREKYCAAGLQCKYWDNKQHSHDPNCRCLGCGANAHARCSRGVDGQANRLCVACIGSNGISMVEGRDFLTTANAKVDSVIQQGIQFLQSQLRVLPYNEFKLEVSNYIDGLYDEEEDDEEEEEVVHKEEEEQSFKNDDDDDEDDGYPAGDESESSKER